MNIIFVSMRSTVSYLGGAEILTQVIAESLVLLGHRVVIYTAGFGGRRCINGVYIQETPLLSFPMKFRTTLLPLYSVLLEVFFGRLKDFIAADVVHAIDSDAIILMSNWKFLQNKFVATIQDYTLIWPTKDYFLKDLGTSHTHKIIYSLVAAIRIKVKLRAVSKLRYAVCVSRFIAKEVNKVNSRMQLAIIGNCISPFWQQIKKLIIRDIDILYVGKLMPYKGVDILLHAIFLLSKTHRCNAVIVGEGLSNRYVRLAKKLGIEDCVTFTGPVAYAQIQGYYLRSKVVVSPSIWPEPCGRSIIEAMWNGCAVVATNVGGTPESLTDYSHGRLVAPNDSHAIAKACSTLLKQGKIRERYGKKAAQFAHKHYSSERIAIEYNRFYTLIKSNRLLL